MKEATGELNMTVITVIAIAAIGVFLFAFLPGILDSIKNNWNKSDCTVNAQGQTVCNGVIQQ
jgi:hypothetical protein